MKNVSIVIPTYKRPDKLSRAIDSVLNQTYTNIEVIVVDDNNPGTDGRKKTEEIMEKYLVNERVHYIKHVTNKNGAAARNTGARHSNAKYIGFLDDDDEYLPQKIENQVRLLESLSEEWGCCYSKFYDCIDGKYYESTETREGDLYLLGLMRCLSFAAGSNMLIRKNLYDKVGGFDESFQRTQDLELLTKLLLHSKVAYDPNPGLIIYVHMENRHADIDKLTQQYILSFKKYIDCLSEKDRKKLFVELNKQRFFDHLRSDRNIIKCFKMLTEGDLSINDAFQIIASRVSGYFKRRFK